MGTIQRLQILLPEQTLSAILGQQRSFDTVLHQRLTFRQIAMKSATSFLP